MVPGDHICHMPCALVLSVWTAARWLGKSLGNFMVNHPRLAHHGAGNHAQLQHWMIIFRAKCWYCWYIFQHHASQMGEVPIKWWWLGTGYGMHEAWLFRRNVAVFFFKRRESTHLPMFKLEHLCGPYPLVNSHIAMERSTIFNGKIHYKWQFSIAMLNYQRVCGPYLQFHCMLNYF